MKVATLNECRSRSQLAAPQKRTLRHRVYVLTQPRRSKATSLTSGSSILLCQCRSVTDSWPGAANGQASTPVAIDVDDDGDVRPQRNQKDIGAGEFRVGQ